MDKMPESALKQFRELVQEFDTCMMTTVGRDGHLHARPMATHEPLHYSPLWFVTLLDSAKVYDLEIDPRVNLAYYRSRDRAWVSVSGQAKIEKNRDKIRELWKDEWKTWCPEGPDQQDVVLLHVEPELVTYWEPESGRVGTLFSIVKARVTGEPVELNPPTTVRVP